MTGHGTAALPALQKVRLDRDWRQATGNGMLSSPCVTGAKFLDTSDPEREAEVREHVEAVTGPYRNFGFS